MVAAIGQQPTFLTVWIGSNDVLGAVLAATPIDGVTMTPLDAFADRLRHPHRRAGDEPPQHRHRGHEHLLATRGGSRSSTTLPTAVDVPGVGTVPLMGEDGPLGAGDYLTLPAARTPRSRAMGLPIPGSPPLPENLNPATGAPGVILRAAEIEIINERLAAVNDIIAGVAAQFPNVHLFDINPTVRGPRQR